MNYIDTVLRCVNDALCTRQLYSLFEAVTWGFSMLVEVTQLYYPWSSDVMWGLGLLRHWQQNPHSYQRKGWTKRLWVWTNRSSRTGSDSMGWSRCNRTRGTRSEHWLLSWNFLHQYISTSPKGHMRLGCHVPVILGIACFPPLSRIELGKLFQRKTASTKSFAKKSLFH